MLISYGHVRDTKLGTYSRRSRCTGPCPSIADGGSGGCLLPHARMLACCTKADSATGPWLRWQEKMEYPSDGNLEKENDTKTRAPTPSLIPLACHRARKSRHGAPSLSPPGLTAKVQLGRVDHGRGSESGCRGPVGAILSEGARRQPHFEVRLGARLLANSRQLARGRRLAGSSPHEPKAEA
jgi:hypothetical protein